MIDYRCRLEAGKFYHIYNRGNNGENLFYNIENYKYFLRKYDEYLSPFLSTFSFCLLPNHFHLLVRIKYGYEVNVSHFLNVKHLETNISKQFQSLFTSYAKSINKQENRKGSLFQKPFKRIAVNNINYLTNLVFYIHANPQMHGIIDDFRMYLWSSYERILKNKPSKLEKESVLEWFADKNNYVAYHYKTADLIDIKHLIVEE